MAILEKIIGSLMKLIILLIRMVRVVMKITNLLV